MPCDVLFPQSMVPIRGPTLVLFKPDPYSYPPYTAYRAAGRQLAYERFIGRSNTGRDVAQWVRSSLSSGTISLDEAAFNQRVRGGAATNQTWVVDFYAPWCTH